MYGRCPAHETIPRSMNTVNSHSYSSEYTDGQSLCTAFMWRLIEAWSPFSAPAIARPAIETRVLPLIGFEEMCWRSRVNDMSSEACTCRRESCAFRNSTLLRITSESSAAKRASSLQETSQRASPQKYAAFSKCDDRCATATSVSEYQ